MMVFVVSKICSVCKKSMSIDEFELSKAAKDGHHTQCKHCKRDQRRLVRRKLKPLSYRCKFISELRKLGLIQCTMCRRVKPIVDFCFQSRSKRSGRSHKCKICDSAETRARYALLDTEARKQLNRKHGDLRRMSRTATPNTYTYMRILNNDPCSYCGAACDHVDHIEPVSKGGRTEWQNLTSACASCNSRKRAKPMLLWMAQR